MHSREYWGGTPYGAPLGERVRALETEVDSIFNRELPSIRAGQERIISDQAELERWLEVLEQKQRESETNDRIRLGVGSALWAVGSNMALWRVISGIAMTGLAAMAYLKGPL